EGGDEGVELAPGAEADGERLLPDEPEHTAREDRGADHPGAARDPAVLGRRWRHRGRRRRAPLHVHRPSGDRRRTATAQADAVSRAGYAADDARERPPPEATAPPAAGSVTVNVVPWPTTLRSVTSPSIMRAKRRASARPRPAPFVSLSCGRSWWNMSKIFSWCSGS